MPILDPRDAPSWGWPDPRHPGEHLWFDYESEIESSADGSGEPDVYYITIADPEGEELAVICHRTSNGYTIDGELAVLKQLNAAWIVDALNAYDGPQPTVSDARAEIARREREGQ